MFDWPLQSQTSPISTSLSSIVFCSPCTVTVNGPPAAGVFSSTRQVLLAAAVADAVASAPQAPVTLTASGYHLRGASVAMCREAAEFVELRLWEEVLLKDPVVSRVEVTCHRARGQRFILALGYTRTLLGSNLPTTIDEVFAAARRKPPTPEERDLIKKRAGRVLAQLRGDSPQLATELAVATALAGGDAKAAVAEVFHVPALDSAALKQMMDRDFDEQGRITVHFSPFEQ